MAELNVQLRADITKFIRALDKAEKALLDMDNAAEDTAASVRNIPAPRNIPKLNKQVANTTPTLLEFNRVIQDAPFGIQGVANNITQLTQNFGQLSQSAGGARAAFSALLGGLAGPAGILFAVSAITSLLVQFGDELFKSTDRAKELADELERVDNLFGSRLAVAEAIGENLELQGKSTEENKRQQIAILNEQLKQVNALQTQNDQLLQQIKLQNEIVSDWELITQLITGTAAAAFITLSGAFDATRKVLDEIRKPLEDLLDIEIDRSGFAAATAEEIQKQNELEVQNNKLKAQSLGLTNDILKLEQAITGEQQKQAGRGAAAIAPQTLTPGGIVQTGDTSVTAPILTSIEEGITEIEALWAAFGPNLQSIADAQIIPVLNNVGQNIGRALAQGGNVLEAIGSTLLQSFGNFLSEFGQKLLLYGKAALAFSKVSVALSNPLTAAPAAGAAIALGAILTAAGAAVSSFASGGLGGGPSGVGGGGGTFTGGFTGGTSPIGGGFTDSRVVFEISGTSLVGVLSRTLNRNQRLGAGIIS